MEPNTDQPNIEAILNGDSREFAKIVDAYKNLVFTVALRMVKNTEEAEEVAQDTFVKVYRSLEKFKGDSKFSTWIYRIAYNTCLDRIKKHKKETHHIAIDEMEGFEIKHMDNALHHLIDKEKSKLVKKCVERLAPKDAALITFFYFEDKNLAELALVMDLTENNVKVALFRARKRLAKVLKEQLNSETIYNYE